MFCREQQLGSHDTVLTQACCLLLLTGLYDSHVAQMGPQQPVAAQDKTHLKHRLHVHCLLRGFDDDQLVKLLYFIS